MKSILIVLVIIVIGGIVWYGIQTKPDASVPQANVSDVNTNTASENEIKADESANKPAVSKKEIDNANVKIAFKGFGPGKVHNGSFTKIDSKLSIDMNDNLSGEIIVDMNSLTTDTEKLTTHLKTDTFFDVAKYPTAKYKISSIKGKNAIGGLAEGVFTIRDISKEVSFPFTNANFNKDRGLNGFSANFSINMKEFGIDQKFANEVVELTVTVPLK